jgi:hypothetical protein
MNTHHYDLQIRVLVTKEDGEFVAHALELDLVGYGASDQAALEALTEMILAQISFAAQKGDDGLIPFRAPAEYFERWDVANLAALKQGILTDKPVKLDAKAVVVTFTQQDVKAARARKFSPLDLALA